MTDLIERLRELERMFCANRCEEPAESGLYRILFNGSQLDAHEDTCEQGADEIERQTTFIDFVFRWVTDEKMTSAEIVSILKHHPRLQDMLAARVAVTAGDHQ